MFIALVFERLSHRPRDLPFCLLHLFKDAIGKPACGIAAPKRPRNSRRAWVSILSGPKSFGLFVDFVPREERRHPPNCGDRQGATIDDVSRTSHANACAAAAVLFAPTQAALCFLDHRVGRHGVDALVISHRRRGFRGRQGIASRRMARARTGRRIAPSGRDRVRSAKAILQRLCRNWRQRLAAKARHCACH